MGGGRVKVTRGTMRTRMMMGGVRRKQMPVCCCNEPQVQPPKLQQKLKKSVQLPVAVDGTAVVAAVAVECRDDGGTDGDSWIVMPVTRPDNCSVELLVVRWPPAGTTATPGTALGT